MYTVLHKIMGITHLYVSRMLPIPSSLEVAINWDNMDPSRKLVNMALRFLPFWNLVSEPT